MTKKEKKNPLLYSLDRLLFSTVSDKHTWTVQERNDYNLLARFLKAYEKVREQVLNKF